MLTFLPSKRWNLIFPCTCRKTKRCITCTMTLSQPRLKLSWAIIMSVPLDWNPDQCFTNTWFNHVIHGQSFSNLTSFTHFQGIEDVLESYSFHKWTVELTQLDTPRWLPEMVLHCSNISSQIPRSSWSFMAQISTAFQWQEISTLESSSILVCNMQPHVFSEPCSLLILQKIWMILL